MQGHIGASLGAIGIVTAIIGATMAGLGAPWWAWVGFAIWGVLWVIAALGLSDKASRAFLAGTLRKSNFTQIYTTLARRNVMRVWARLCDTAPDSASAPALLRAAATWRLFDFALRLAVAYPLLLLVGQWVVTGAEGRVGSFVVLPAAAFWPERAVTVVMVLILTGAVLGDQLGSAKKRPLAKRAAWPLPAAVAVVAAGALESAVALAIAAALAFAAAVAVAVSVAFASILAVVVAVAFAFAGAGAGGGAVAVAGTLAGVFAGGVTIACAFAVSVTLSAAFAFAGAFAFALAGALAGAGALTLAGAFAGAVVVAVELLDRRGRQRLARLVLTAAVTVAVFITATTLDWAEVAEDRRSVFLFLAVLPLINALFDVVSYAVTLSLIRRGLRSGLPFLWGLADLGLACGLLLGLGAVLVAVIHGLNLLAGVPFVDLPGLFAGVQADPGAYVWLYLMLFSTLLPTLLHGVLSLLGVQGIWPLGLRRPVAGWVASAPASPLHALRASLGLSLVWALPLLGLAVVLWLIWHYAQPALVAGLQFYLDGLLWIATHPVGAL